MNATKCPKCGQEMGPQTMPDDGTMWCGSIRCGHHVGPDSPIEDVREYLISNGIDTREVVSRVLKAARAAGCVIEFCEHGVRDGDWCEKCNAAMKKARAENQ